MFYLDKIVPIFAACKQIKYSMRIKLLAIVACCLSIPLTFTSCLNNDDEVNYSNSAAITSFTLKNIKTVIIANEDTTSFTVKGSDYPFSIDQLSPVGRIFNRDSLPVNTDITKVAFSLGYTAAGISYTIKDVSGNDSIAWVGENDSLDFTRPVIFRVHAADGINKKEYEVKINVHQVVPDSMVWNQYRESNFPGLSINAGQKAVKFADKVFVFSDGDPQIGVTSTDVNDGINWTGLTEIGGVDTKAEYSSVIEFQGRLYLIAGGELYSSGNGLNWTKENVQATTLLAAFTNRLLGINGEDFIQILLNNNTLVSENTGYSKPDNFPVGNYSYVRSNLKTNPNIERLVLMGEMPSASDTSAVAWSILSTEKTWADFQPSNQYDCPNLNNISMISYDNQLYAFGGANRDSNQDIKAFQSFYISKDDGRTWIPTERYILFPEEFLGVDKPFSYIVDDENFLWIMRSGEAGIWKGRINRLGF